jgi:hypothetical protein
MSPKHRVRDPDRTAVSYHAVDPTQVGQWQTWELVEMDMAFRAAMTKAVASGQEYCATSVSTSFGTRRPVSGYERGDCQDRGETGIA